MSVDLTCHDCGILAWELEDGTHEDFYVHDDLWHRACPDDNGFLLCIGCFEKRLGRQLVRSDFKNKPP